MTTLREALFAPRSVAIVGQSNDAGKTAGRPLKYLRQAGFAGDIYPVNPGRDQVLGERAWPSLDALPQVPDHAYIVTGTDAAIEAVATCGRLGVKVATVLADGFAEGGEAGRAKVDALRTIAARTGLRIVGPSSLGVVDLRTKAMITANAAFDETELPVGRIFAASHSGSMIGALLSRGKARDIGFAALVSVGNEVDLSLGEICEAMLDDPGIDGFMLFLETMRNTAALRRFALAAAARKKPVLAYKLGRSDAARELAVTHTGALAGEDDVASAFLAACGIARVDSLDGLVEGLPLLARLPARQSGDRPPAVGVVTTTGGGATMAIDPLAARGITIAQPSEATLARLAACGLDVKPARLVDLTLTGTRYEAMKSALDVLTTAPEFDLVLCVVGSSARFYPELAVKPIVDSGGARTPLVAYLTPEAPDALAMLSRAGVPNFRTPEACADAVAAALRRRAPNVPAEPWPASSPPSTASAAAGHDMKAFGDRGATAQMLDECAAYALLERRGIACAPSVALDCRITQVPAMPFPYPVAVKALSAQVAHKTELGGVVLNVVDDAALLAAIAGIRVSVASAGISLDRVLVQPMCGGLGEVLLGYRLDPDVGPLVMIAAGGILAEIYRDRSLRLAPIDLASAQEMIGEVRALAALAGFRGRPRGDFDALAQALVALSLFAGDAGVLEAEINPLIVRQEGEGVVAVDALVRCQVRGRYKESQFTDTSP